MSKFDNEKEKMKTVWNEKGINTDITSRYRFKIIKYYEQLHINTFENLDETHF